MPFLPTSSHPLPLPKRADRRRCLRLAAALAVTVGAAALPQPGRAQQAYEDFIFAVANDRAPQVKSLLARGIDPDTVDRSGNPALVIAAREGYAATVDVLLAGRANVNARSPTGDTAMMVAALGGHLDLVKKLRASGGAVNPAGWTPLIYAATGGRDDIVRYLLAEGADINAVSPNGTTALMMAVRENRDTTAELLLARGADPNIRNQDGAGALDWAKRNNDNALVARLRRAGARD